MVEDGNETGSHTYCESLTVPPIELPQRSPRYRNALPTGSTNVLCDPNVTLSPTFCQALHVP